MRPIYLLLLVPCLLLFAACGGSGDDDGGDDPPPADAETEDSGSQDQDGGDGGNDDGDGSSAGDSGSGGDANLPDLDDAAYQRGTLRVQVSGDEDATLELEGGGFVLSGLAILTFGSQDASSQLTFGDTGGSEPGAFAIQTTDFSTAAEWGAGCEITVDQSDGKLSGEFRCEDIDGITLDDVEELTLTVEGTFSLEE